MFLQLEHKKADLYTLSKKILYLCYEITHDITAEEKVLLSEQIRKAALIAHLNIIKGLFSGKGKMQRKRLRRAKNALIVLDAGLEIILQLGWVTTLQITDLEQQMQMSFHALSKILKK